MDAMTPPEAMDQGQRDEPRVRKQKRTPEEIKAANAESARRYRERHGLTKKAKTTGQVGQGGKTEQVENDKPWESGAKPAGDEAFSEPGVKREAPRKRKAKAVDPADVNRLAQFLGAAHMMLANGMKAPEMVLHEAECQALASSLIGVMEQYDYTLDPKIAAVVSLAVVSFGIYVPRLAAVGARVKAQKAQAMPRPAQPHQTGNVATAGMTPPQARQAPQPAPAPHSYSGPVQEPGPAQPDMYGAPLQYDGPAGTE